jgi:hypothetical protein
MSRKARTKNYHTSRERVKTNGCSGTFPPSFRRTQDGSLLFIVIGASGSSEADRASHVGPAGDERP